MKIIDCCLEKTLKHMSEHEPSDFPLDHSRKSYWNRYHDMAVKLNTEFHPNVESGSTAADGGMLTDHGPDHIKTVMNRAAELLHDIDNPYSLTGYEVYYLLCAIHFHDLGNIEGRVKHEKRIDRMMKLVEGHLGDSFEKKVIREIAEVHGGKVGSDKDTITHLSNKTAVSSKYVRSKLLASILRFSDELADDKYRANLTMLKMGLVPDSSLIYHKYAACLDSVISKPAENLVEMHFHIPANDLTKPIKKFNHRTKRFRKQYLLDEIFERCLKTYQERTYCNRYMSPLVDIRSILVEITCSLENEIVGDPIPKINFRLEERGYPGDHDHGIYHICEELSNWGMSGKRLTGLTFAREIEKTISVGQKNE